jgi:hypothetical protein
VIIVVLFVIAAIIIVIFGYLQHRLQDKAALPPRIMKNRSIFAGAWFKFCINGTLTVAEQYLPIYSQSVKCYTAVKTGIPGIVLIPGIALATPLGTAAISLVGY